MKEQSKRERLRQRGTIRMVGEDIPAAADPVRRIRTCSVVQGGQRLGQQMSRLSCICARWHRRGIGTLLTLARGGVAVVVVTMVINLMAAFGTKAPCLTGPASAARPFYCYSDVQSLFVLRHLSDHVFPYVHGNYVTSSTGSVFLTRGEVEYPVLTGLFMWLAALPVQSQDAYFALSALLLAALGLVSAWLLARMCGARALLFAGAPGVALYGFINWDFISIVLAVGGVYLWWRDRPYLAAAAFAVGGCVKLWPAFLLVPLVADLMAAGDWRKGARAGLLGGGIGLGVNVPFAIANFRGWYAPFAYQGALGLGSPQGMSLWDWYGRWLNPGLAEALASFAMLAGLGVVTALGWVRYRREGAFPFVQVCAATTLLYILTAKDNSAQYVLWVLPFFAMLRLRPALWVLWGAVGAAWYVRFVVGLSPVGFGLVTMMEAVVAGWVLVSALGAESVVGQVRGQQQRRARRASLMLRGRSWAPGASPGTALTLNRSR